jgi:PHD/YefM family antitoxin component YafN of YafNO toxin-antitoxin module
MVANRGKGSHGRGTVTVHGRPSAVLIAPEDLERLEEMLEIMRDVATMNRLVGISARTYGIWHAVATGATVLP